MADFDARFFEFSLGSFSALCKISDSTIFETLHLQDFSSNSIQTLWEHCLPWRNASYYSSWKSAKFYKIYGTFEILTLESMGKAKMWNISKTADSRARWFIDRRAKRKVCHFEIFLITGPYATGNVKVLFLPQFFISTHPTFMATLVTMINLNAS